MAGDHLDLTSDPHSGKPSNNQRKDPRYLGIRFDCCKIYVRIYLNRDGTAYEGRCPRCLRPVRFIVGAGGSDARFFTVS